ncbi:MAG TPA: RNA 2',3'-cyclic phosphodiesterase [Candidatus Limnocylindria bacterium]|nr:RNA 2',3'-cyclic phosphodiesterase [Candidatus Limnocylindria bacterium]
MRLFVAVPLPEDIATAASEALPELPGVRRVPPELTHVTLAFLGNVDAGRLPDVVAAVREAAAGRPPFDVSIEGFGRFPRSGGPRIVWLGIVRGAAELITLAERVRAALAARDLPFDPKPFRAHLTVARIGDRADRTTIRALVSAIERAKRPALTLRADALVCFESVWGKGPRYTARATVSLEAGEKR